MKRVMIVMACMAAVFILLWCACRVAFGWSGDEWSGGEWAGGPWAVSRDGGPFRDDFSLGLDAWESSVNWEVKAGYARLVLYDSQYVTPPDGTDDLTNLVPNGDFESGTTGWTAINGGIIATSTTAQAGAWALSVTRGPSNISGRTTAVVTPVAGGFYAWSAWLQNVDAQAVGSILAYPGVSGLYYAGYNNYSYYIIRRTVQQATGFNAFYPVTFLTQYDSGMSGVFDSFGCYKIAPADIFCARDGGKRRSVRAKIYPGVTGWHGVVSRLDSVTAPLNAICAGYDSVTGKVEAKKIVNGAWTTLLSVAATKANWAYLEIRYVADDQYSVFYNGTQVGTTQAVTGLNGSLYGLFCAGGILNSSAEYANLNGVSGGAAAGFDDVEVW